jgi:hypothetical protein
VSLEKGCILKGRDCSINLECFFLSSDLECILSLHLKMVHKLSQSLPSILEKMSQAVQLVNLELVCERV